MKKHVHTKFLALAIMAGFFTANAQEVVENFQTWAQMNAVDKNTTYNCDPVSVDGTTNVSPAGGHGFVAAPIPVIELPKVYGAITVNYKITNGGVWPACAPKSTYAVVNSSGVYTAAIPATDGVSNGYVEINKAATGSPAGTVGGIFEIGKMDYIDKIYLTTSGTGSSRSFKVSYSTDGGTSWTENTVDGPFSTGRTGDIFKLTVQLQGVSVKVESLSEIIRIHDFNIYTTLTSVSDLFINGTATVKVSENTLMVSSKEAGTVEVVSSNGVLVAESDIADGNEKAFNISTAGMYIVKLATSKGVSTRKIIIQ